MKDNGVKLTKERSRRYPAQTIKDAYYADDIALLANTPVQAETLLHSLERAAAGIDLHVNTDKTEYVCFNQRGEISILNGSSLKLVDKFTYLGSSVSITETSTLDQQRHGQRLVIWKSDLTDKMKRSFFQAILKKSWRQHPTKQQLYDHLLLITKISKLDEPDVQDTAGEVGTSS